MTESLEVASSPCAAGEADWGFEQGSDLVVLVLAGGEGKRMGGDKPERRLGDRRLIDRALDVARRYGTQVAIGLRAAGQISVPDDVERVIDQAGIDGPLASLAAGTAWAKRCGARCLLTIPCDAPFLPYDLARRLLTRLQASDTAVAAPKSHGRTHPSCALWRVSASGQLVAYLAGGRRSLIGFAEHLGFAIEDWGAAPRDPFFNVNTPDDLRAAENVLAHPHFE